MKVLVFGNGWLGNKFRELFDGSITDTRIEDAERVRQDLEAFRPDVVINTAGKPSGDNNIDWCLDHPGETITSNITGPAVLAQACKDFDVPLFVQLSSGCIFDGPGGVSFSETAVPNPVNLYGTTRASSELIVREIFRDRPTKILIPRFRMPLDKEPHGRNLITKLIKYVGGSNPIVSAPNSITVVDDLLAAVRTLITRNRSGIYHVVNPSPVTHLQIIDWCYDAGLIRSQTSFEVVTPERFAKCRVTRDGRSNCVLDDTKLRWIEGIVLRDSEEAIKECILTYRENLQKVR